MSELRHYQQHGVQLLRDGLKTGKKRQILYLPTGGGKSRLAAELIRNARIKNNRVAFVCNRIELVTQASEVLHGQGIHHGIIQGNNSYKTDAPVVVCSIQTLDRRGFPDIGLLIVDEAHSCAGSKAYRKLFTAYNNVPVIGLSATPFSKGLGKHYDEMHGPLFDSIVIAATIPQLIEEGYLVDCDIYSSSEPDLTGVKTVAGDYNQKQLDEAVDKETLVGDIVEHYLRLAKGKAAICFATNIAHSMHIVQQFQRAGIDARHIDAYTPEDDRRELINKFKADEYPILSNCSLLAEGFDCPQTEVIILARPTKSLIRYIQMAGRALRPHDGKERALILDHSGTVRRLGFPTDELPLELDDGNPKESTPSDRLPKVCASCGFIYARSLKACPKCGFEPVKTAKEVEFEDGLLRKIEKRKASSLDKQAVFSALYSLKESKGYKDGWVSHNYREIIGVWPQGMQKIAGPIIQAVENHLLHKRIAYAKRRK